MRSPPPPLEGDDTKAYSLRQELSKRPMVDNDLDISVDLGEAVARTPQPKSRPSESSPMLLDYPSPIPNAKSAPVVRPQPGECKKLGSFPHLCSTLIVLVLLSWSSMCGRGRHRIADLSSCVIIVPGCDSEEPHRASGTSKPAQHHGRRVEREKAKKGEKDET